MPKSKKEAKNEDGSPEEYKSFDGDLEEALGDDVIDAIIPTDGDDFNPETLGIDKNMDSFDDQDLF